MCNFDLAIFLALTALMFVLLLAFGLRAGRVTKVSRPKRRLFWYRRVRPRKVHKLGQRKPDWAIKEVIWLKAHTGQSCRQLAATFNKLYAAERNVSIGKTWVASILRQHQYEVNSARFQFKSRTPVPLPRNHIWGFDLTGKADRQGRIHPILGIVDYGSRLALSLRPLPNRSAVVLLKALLAAIERYGMPTELRTDNEPVFHSRLFRFALAWLGIRHRFSRPGQPWQNGRVERLFRTLKDKLNSLSVPNYPSLQFAMAEFACWYNEVRPHQQLHGLTPLEAWQGIDPYRRAPESAWHFSAWDGLLEGIYLKR